MTEKEKKQQIIKISVFITSIFIILLSGTYAFLHVTLIGEKRQVIIAGNLELELLEDENNLTIKNALPMYDEVGMIGDAFTFRLVNKIKNITSYTVKLVDITTGEKLDTKLVKYGLTKDNEKTISFISNTKDNIIDSGTIPGETTIEYSLRLWIDSNVEDSALISGKSLKYKIIIEASPETENLSAAMIKKRNSERSTESFWNYRDRITSVAFENEIDLPDNIEEDKKWDISADGNESIMAYIEEDGLGTNTYKLHIQGNGKIVANTDSSYLFYGFSNLTSIEGLEYFNTKDVTDMRFMFADCNSLINLHLSSLNTSKVTTMQGMFNDCNNLTTLDVSSFNTANVVNMSWMFAGCSNLTTLDVSNFNTTNVVNMSGMFSRCSNLINLNVRNFNTSNVTDISSLFALCSSLVNLDVSNFDTTNVVNMSNMFQGCNSLKSLNVRNFDTTNTTDMSAMFSLCSNLTTLDVSNFNTSNVTNMKNMFSYCSNLTVLDLSNFDTTNVTDMSWMFLKNSSLTTLDISNFDTSKVTDHSYMFDYLKNNCFITVKNATMIDWVKNANSNLTNVVEKSA